MQDESRAYRRIAYVGCYVFDGLLHGWLLILLATKKKDKIDATAIPMSNPNIPGTKKAQ